MRVRTVAKNHLCAGRRNRDHHNIRALGADMAKGRGQGLTVNRGEMADLAGIAPTTLDAWVRRGCPAVARGGHGRPWAFNSADVFAWRLEDVRAQVKGVGASSMEELHRRKLEAEVELAELESAREQGVVAPVEQFERAMSKAFGEVRSRLRGVLPGRVASRIAALTSEAEIKAVLREEIDGALEVLAAAELIEETELDLDADAA